jgi:hypothetical protein
METCASCRFGYLVKSGNAVFCERYPKAEIKGLSDWCGEYKVSQEYVKSDKLKLCACPERVKNRQPKLDDAPCFACGLYRHE